MRYDYQNQAWLDDNERYMNCGHPEDSPYCTCYGRLHAGKTEMEVQYEIPVLQGVQDTNPAQKR